MVQFDIFDQAMCEISAFKEHEIIDIFCTFQVVQNDMIRSMSHTHNWTSLMVNTLLYFSHDPSCLLSKSCDCASLSKVLTTLITALKHLYTWFCPLEHITYDLYACTCTVKDLRTGKICTATGSSTSIVTV